MEGVPPTMVQELDWKVDCPFEGEEQQEVEWVP